MIFNNPKIGSKRLVKRFAWFPTRIDETTVIWFHHYYLQQSYSKYHIWINGKRTLKRVLSLK